MPSTWARRTMCANRCCRRGSPRGYHGAQMWWGPPTGVKPATATSNDNDQLIPVELGGTTRMLARSSVRWVEAQGDYARLHTADASHLVRVSLATLAEQWADAGFVRVHRSFLV